MLDLKHKEGLIREPGSHWMVGPCYRCGEIGHLVANCPKPRQQYPFEQSLVKGTDLSRDLISVQCVDVTIRVDMEKGEWAALSPEGVYHVMTMEQDEVSEFLQLWATGNEYQVSDSWEQKQEVQSKILQKVGIKCS